MGEEYRNEFLEMMNLSMPEFRKAHAEWSNRMWSGERMYLDD